MVDAFFLDESKWAARSGWIWIDWSEAFWAAGSGWRWIDWRWSGPQGLDGDG